MDLFGLKAKRQAKENARRDREYEAYIDKKIDAANTKDHHSRALNELCELFKSPYYESDPVRVEARRTILSQRLSALDLSQVVEAIIEKAYPSMFLGSERDVEMPTIQARDDLAAFVASHFSVDPKLRDKALEGMNGKTSPEKYRFLAQTTSHGYDSQVLAAYKQKLTSQTFGPWTDYLAQPLVETIIASTFDPETRVDLREQGVDFLVDELRVKPEGKNIPRNMLYVTKVARALWDHRKDPIVARRFEEIYTVTQEQAKTYSDFAMFSALTSLENRNRVQVEEAERAHATGGLNAVNAYIQEKGLSRSEIFKIPLAGTCYDRVPYTCEKTARELFGVIGVQ